ncbi:zinc finger MYM-type protein 1-like [Salvia splendens]|uniref:zinc finger MYM-type protein 1-like n=1 Tax=Salvia splendens TaxID=180675 RepID=UPI001C254D15|nr:zinc finger MYM-type protein 1-like [Salvia splendens]
MRKTHDSSSSPASSSLPSSSPASSTPLSSSPPSISPASNSIGIVSPSDASLPLHEEELIYDIEKLHHDPIRRTDIMKYPPNERDTIRRAYILRKPCQPRTFSFPQKEVGGSRRRFMVSWFDKWDWLEYSMDEDAAFCFVYYLFKNEVGHAGGDAFVNKGFKSWNKPERFIKHIGGVRSAHNIAYEKYVNLRDGKKKSILVSLDNVSDVINNEYNVRLKASISCLRYLLGQGMAFRGHREGEDSLNRGNFLELLKWLKAHNEVISKVTLENAPGNCQLTSPTIQKDIINCCAKETMKRIVDDLGDDYFAILADESSDMSQKEQLALYLRYVEKKRGKVVERFIGLVHVGDTTSLSLRSAIMTLLVEHSLSQSKIRGQGYDGASNMKGEIHGLKTLIMKDTPSAYYVHCFAHQLQLTLVAISKKNDDCSWLFETVSILLNVIGVSCKRNALLREVQAQKVAQALEIGELESGSGLNQELSLKRPGDTRWSSHYKTLLNIMDLFSTIFEVLTMIGKKDSVFDDMGKAQGILYLLESFDFVFMAQLMTTIFGYTNNLCLALQRRDQDIITAMRLVTLTKDQLQKMREDGWEIHLNKVISICNKHGIVVPDMKAHYSPHGRSKRFVQQVSYLHHFRVDVFIKVIDLLLQELDNRFDEVNMELLRCMACFNPKDGFSSFDKEKVLKLATFYPSNFSNIDLMDLECQLDIFIGDMRSDEDFQNLRDISSLLMKLVETKRDVVYSRVVLLIKLILILPVATASVERVFSGMTFVKNKLRNRMGDQPLNDCLVTFIEKDVFLQVSDEDIVNRFEEMKTRRKIN